MSFRSIARDIRDSIGNLSRRSFDPRLSGHNRGKSHGSFHDLNDQPLVIQSSRWANLPPELLFDIIKRLEESESTWPARKHVVACSAVCRSWRSMCKEIVKSLESCGKLTFPVSLKQVLELGIIVHSVIIGIALGASQNPETIRPLIAALTFHQFFEGIGVLEDV